MDTILTILRDLHANVDWANEKALADDGLLDSFDIITLVNELNDCFDVEIGLEQLEPENFNTVGAMAALVKSLGADL